MHFVKFCIISRVVKFTLTKQKYLNIYWHARFIPFSRKKILPINHRKFTLEKSSFLAHSVRYACVHIHTDTHACIAYTDEILHEKYNASISKRVSGII